MAAHSMPAAAISTVGPASAIVIAREAADAPVNLPVAEVPSKVGYERGNHWRNKQDVLHSTRNYQRRRAERRGGPLRRSLIQRPRRLRSILRRRARSSICALCQLLPTRLRILVQPLKSRWSRWTGSSL